MIGVLLLVLGSVSGMKEVAAEPLVLVEPGKDGSLAVTVEGRVLLTVRYPDHEDARKARAEEIARRLRKVLTHPFESPPNFWVEEKKDRVEAYCEEQLLFSVFPPEARHHHSSLLDLALVWLNNVQMEFYGLSGNKAVPQGKVEGMASWCHIRFHGRRTALGEIHNAYAFTAAHRELPLGGVVLVTNLRNGKKVVVRINDRGPWNKSRMVDLSLAAARVLGIQRSGIGKVCLEVIPWKKR